MTISNLLKKGLLLALFVFLGFSSAIAQTSKGILVGVARDTTGAVIQNATVHIRNMDTGELRNATTKTDGSYRIEAIPPGRYAITVEETGFETAKADGVVVNPSVVSSYDVVLHIGKANDVVEVAAVSNTINTDNGQLTGLISSTDIRALPVFSLNPIELATTLPGIQVITQPSSGVGAQGQVFSANGARPRANNFLIDGQEINDVAIAGQGFQPDIPGMYSTVAVIANSASAEYGRAGGAITNVVTQRGSNTFHGSAYERYTGSGLNALSGTQRQSKSSPTPPIKTRFDRHTFGFTGGGPIFKDKLFVFGAGQWQRFYGQTLVGRQELPDASGVKQLQAIQAQAGTVQAQQSALFANYLSGYSYLSSFANTTITTGNPTLSFNNYSLISPGCPTKGCSITTALFQRPSVPEQNTDTQFGIRVDYTPHERDNIAVRYIHDRGFLTPDFGNNASLPGFDSQQGGFSELAQVAYTHVFNPRILNEFRVSETRLNFAFAFTPQTLANSLNLTPSITFGGVTSNFPSLGPNQNLPQGRGEDLYQLQDTVGLTFGKQSIRAGFDVGRQIEQEIISQNAIGSLTYGAGGSYGSALGEFINNFIGTSGSVAKTFGKTRIDPHNWRLAFFAQDDVKLTPELTLNFGVRYDYLTDPDNNLPYPSINPLSALTDSITTVYKVNSDTNNISPRAGFAYVPHFGFFSDGKTVFHTGLGIYFDTDFSNIVVNSAQSSPNAPTGGTTYTAKDGIANSNALIPALTPLLTNLSNVNSSVVNNLVNPYTYQYNLGMERELPFNLKLTTNFVASRGVKLYAGRQFNYFTPTDGTAATARLNPARGAIIARGNFATSSYNSLQAELSRSFVRGMTFRAAYTYGKDLDNASEIFNTFNSPTIYQADLSSNGMRQEWGNSAWDHRNYIVLSYVWAPKGYTASGAFTNGVLGAFTRHWTISGVERFQSGPYSSINASGFDSNGDGSTANDRPIIGNPSAPFNTAGIDASQLGGTQGTYYNLNVYNNPATSKQKVLVDPNTVHFLVQRGQHFLSQEVGRDSYLQPGYQQHDLAVEKGFGLSYLHFEQGSLNLRAEANNVGNHNNVNPLGVNVSLFGASSQLNPVVSRTGTGRSLVLWAVLKF
jgi:Carboxypeptidase regulatory-like domain/TonB-dependent Receptor Plug Domain/TonB dependent receptor